MTSFLSEKEVSQIGFKSVGSGVSISRNAKFYSPQNIIIGDHSRIDDFCVISAGKEVIIGSNVHIAVFCLLMGNESIVVDDYANLSSRVTIYSSTDDFSGEYMTNPTVDKRYTNVISKPVHIKGHVVIGSGSIVMPGVTLEEGVAIGALSFVNKNCEAFKIYGGIPAKFLKNRSKELLDFDL